MPLKVGKSKKVLTYNIREMMNSSTFAAGKSKKKKQSMAIAASYASARKAGGKFPRKRKK
ncbi:MAG: hypothetical protein IMF11_05400 [Proteobacteria bacterium]|nr:hypothetical protein [Pseudomonadota bacterium]